MSTKSSETNYNIATKKSKVFLDCILGTICLDWWWSSTTFYFRSQLGFDIKFQAQFFEDDLSSLQNNQESKDSGKYTILKTDEGGGDIYLEAYTHKKNNIRI